MKLHGEIIVDNFAGGGGTSTGIELATGRPVDIAINHDPDAILMHKTNHPYTKHYCESVWDVDPKKICGGHPVGLMWLSPDCKHFSRAKGGKPVDKHIRGLAWLAVRWASSVKPRVIILENVPEFVTWGPIDKNGYPDPKQKGETFKSFVKSLKSYGYEVDWRELKACDYGAPTIRKRFFLVARCDGKPIVFPTPTHSESKDLKPYRTAAECIDWSIPCKSIFERKKPLADNTLRRIARGLDKFTIKSDAPFIVNYIMPNNTSNVPKSVIEPLPTITTGNRNFLCSPHISKYYSGIVGSKADEPLPTVTAIDHNAVVAPSLIQYHSETSQSEIRGQTLDKPIMTVDGSNRYGLVESHLCVLRKNMDCKSMKDPMPTITTSGGHFAEIRTHIVRYSEDVDLCQWKNVREMLNKYCGYSLSNDEVLLLEINQDLYFIADIGMRMLEPRELYNAQGFPPDYIIGLDYTGKTYPRTKQVARCGNAVPPPFAEALVRANLPEMCCNKKITTMKELGEIFNAT